MYLHNYGIASENKYKMKRLVREFLSSLKEKYIPKNLTKFFDIKFSCENHLAERMIERRINKKAFERVITSLVKYKLCEIIYLTVREPTIRINLRDETGLVVGISGKHFSDGSFNIKIHTCFVNKDYSGHLIKNKTISI